MKIPDISKLESMIQQLAPSWHGCANAPDDYDSMIEWANSARAKLLPKDEWHMPVSNEFCDASIYSSAEVNMAFRAYHDYIHLTKNKGFSLASEIDVALVHQMHAREWGLPESLQRILWIDTAGQNIYQVEHGEFPTDQRAFVAHAYNVSLNHAIKTGGF